MKHDRRIITGIIYLLLGAALFGLSLTKITDGFWSGMGSALIVVGVIQIVQFFRLKKDSAYRETVEVELSDERSRFIRNKAWAWSAYLFILIAAVAAIVLKLLGQDLLSIATGFAVCILMLLYWVCYIILRKKY